MARVPVGIRIDLLPVGDKSKIPNLKVFSKWLTTEGARLYAKEIVLKEYTYLVRDWKHKPDFGIRATIRNKEEFGVWVYPKGANADIYRWVTLGTPPHMEYSPFTLMSFLSRYNPRTRPLKLESGTPWYLPPRVKTRIVHHPGIRARVFEYPLAQKVGPLMAPYLQKFINQMVRAQTMETISSNWEQSVAKTDSFIARMRAKWGLK